MTLAALVAAGASLAATRPRNGDYRGKTAVGFQVKFRVVGVGPLVRGLVTRVRYRCAPNSPLVSAEFSPYRSMRVRRGRFAGRDGYVTLHGTFKTATRASGTVSIYRKFSSGTVCTARQTWSARRG